MARHCRRCTHWEGNGEAIDRDDPVLVGKKVELGACHRFAPRPGDGCDEDGAGFWPRVASDAWCGEWEPDLD